MNKNIIPFTRSIDKNGIQLCLKQDDSCFRCLCDNSKAYITANGLRKHIRSSKCPVLDSVTFDPSLFNYDDDISDEELEASVCGKNYIAVPTPVWPVKTELIGRDCDGALLNAMGAVDWSENEKRRVRLFMDGYDMQPIALIDDKQHETNALTYKNNLAAINGKTLKISAVIPDKRKFDHTIDATLPLSPCLFSAIRAGPKHLRHYVLDSNYLELTSEMAKFMNQDWMLHPKLRFACSRVLAGAIILDPFTCHALLVNCIEIYGRRRTIDSHRESFRAVKGMPTPSSLPPVGTRYENVFPTSLPTSDGTKFVIGTKTFNALVTSSLRLHAPGDREIGPATTSLVLDTPTKSKNALIFIKKISWEAAVDLSKRNDDVCSITSFDLIYQLRQLRTRFHHLSTYIMCRAFNDITDDITTRPYTIFTLADWDNGSDNAGYRIGSRLMQNVAMAVIRKGNEAYLEKETTRKLLANLDPNKEMHHKFTAILNLFVDDEEQLNIARNVILNSLLQDIVKLLMTSVHNANESAKQAVALSFMKF